MYKTKLTIRSIFSLLIILSTACEDETIKVLTQAERDDIILQDYFTANQLSPTKTATGLYYEVLEEGQGSIPPSGTVISLDYEGKILYGDIFDSSFFRGEPIIVEQGTGRTVEEFDENGNPVFGTGGVIEGWREATQLMRIGDKFRIYIPSELAYGTRGNQGIPPSTILIFEIVLNETL